MRVSQGDVLAAARFRARASQGLVYVPDLTRDMMARGASREAALEAIEFAAREGKLELRPHSGLDPVPVVDKSLVVMGLDAASDDDRYTVQLSYARVV